MKNKPQYLLLFLLIFFTISKYQTYAQAPNFDVMSIEQFNYVEPANGLLDVGQIKVQRNDFSNPNLVFLSIVMRCPTGDTVPLVLNVPFPPFPDPSFDFPTALTLPLDPCDFFPPPIPPVPEIPIELVELSLISTPQPILEAPVNLNFQNYFPIIVDFEIFSNPRAEIVREAVPALFFLEPLPCVFNPFDSVVYKERGCDMPNLDLDNSANPPTPTYGGDKNACVPTATSNSIMWLRDQHPEIMAIIDSVFADGATRHRDLMEDISGVFGRDSCEGVSFRNFVRGKQALVDKYKLPIKVKFQNVFIDHDLISADTRYGNVADNQNTNSKEIDMEWVFNELCDGEDIEVDYDCFWVDDMGNKLPDDPATAKDESYDYGHCVTLTGVYKHNGQYGMRYKHDTDQDAVGGTQMDFTWLKNDPTPGISGKLLLDNGSNRTLTIEWVDGMGNPVDTTVYTSRCFIGDVVSESYDESITFDSIPCPPSITYNAGDTLCSGIIKADTICLNNTHIKGGQELILIGKDITIKPVFTSGQPISVYRTDETGCD